MEKSGLKISLKANLSFTYYTSPDYIGKKSK
jgi:hypothetical protein